MNEKAPPKARISKDKKVSSIWLLPVAALVIGIWMLFQSVSNTGPDITLEMTDATGIEVGKTEIKSLNVKVGVVSKVKLSDDYDHIIITARMDKDAERMLKEDTQFWVVKPRIGKEGISGLDTILSGSYIEMQPGKAEEERLDFKVLEQPPLTSADAKGLRLMLTNDKASGLHAGDAVTYKGFTAGRVEMVDFDLRQGKAQYQVFIFEPYNDLIRSGTRFWINSGVDVNLSDKGINLRMESLDSLLTGGISFAIPEGVATGGPVTEPMTRFQLFDNLDHISEGQYEDSVEYVMVFEESLRGLNPGAAVEFRGLRIGSVIKVPLSLPSVDKPFDSKRLPVLIKLEPQRIFTDYADANDDQFNQIMLDEFAKGLKGTMKTGSLLTGALYIDIDYDTSEQATPYLPQQISGYEVFPTRQGEFTQIQKQVTDILDKFDKLPLDDTVASVNRSLAGLEQTLKSAERMIGSIETLVEQDQTQALPVSLQQSLDQLQTTLKGFSQGSPAYQNLDQALVRLDKVMSDLQPVLRTLNEKPNALVFGQEETADPVPVKGKQ